MITNGQIEVTTSRGIVASASRNSTVLISSASGTVYLGNNSVTTGNGFAIGAVSVSIPLSCGDDLYAIAGSTTAVFVLITD